MFGHQQIQSQIARVSNPEITDGTQVTPAVFITATAISGALYGALTGAVFTQDHWYQGLWRGALGGAAVLGGIGAILAALEKPGELYLAGMSMDASDCDPSWKSILSDALNSGVLAAIVGAGAGAAVGKGDRGRMALKAAGWNAAIFAMATTALDMTRKLAPPQRCLSA